MSLGDEIMKTLRNLKLIIKENKQNSGKLIRLSWYELIAQNNDTVLGLLWNFITPALQIFVYWFVFAIGLKARSPIDGYPYIIWMIVGIFPWLFISSSILTGSKSIIAYSNVIKRMKFPIGIVPTKSVVSSLITHLFSVAIIIGVLIIGGYYIDIHAVQLIYYMICSVVLVLGIAFLFSAITVVSKDFLNTLPSIIRLIFYMTPILWPIENIGGELGAILQFNPIYYIVNGYRESLLYKTPMFSTPIYDIVFWISAIVILTLGVNVHMKLRNKFVDLI